MKMKKLAVAVSLACAGLVVSPAALSAFPEAGVDNVQSLAQFKITFTKKFAVYLRDNMNAPFCNSFTIYDCPQNLREFTSQMLYERYTKVGRSSPHPDGGLVDEQTGAKICKDGNTTSCNGFFSWTDEPIIDAHFQWKKDGYQKDGKPFDEGPKGREEIHTQVVAFKLTPLRGGSSKNAVRAGKQAPCQARSLGEVESLNGNGFPAESFFQMYVDVDVDWDNNGSVDMVLFNQAGINGTILGGDPLIIESTGLTGFPPKVIYSHTGETKDKVAPKLYIGKKDRPKDGEDQAEKDDPRCKMAPDPNNELYNGEEKHIGWIRIATHGINFGPLNTKKSTREATPSVCKEGEDDLSCFSNYFNSLPMAPILDEEDGPFPNNPNLIELESFMALTVGGNVALGWTTASEIGNAGFHIWRARKNQAGEYIDIVKLTNQLIPTQGVSHNGITYSYIDSGVVSGNTYYYALEDVDFNDNSKIHLESIASTTVN